MEIIVRDHFGAAHAQLSQHSGNGIPVLLRKINNVVEYIPERRKNLMPMERIFGLSIIFYSLSFQSFGANPFLKRETASGSCGYIKKAIISKITVFIIIQS